MKLADLEPNTKNPRKAWSAAQLDAFRKSLVKFGDLGGIVRNLTTNQLIGGHKRVEAFHSSPNVEIVATRQDIDAQGTVAHGYVIVDGNRFGYREVRWSVDDETAANLAANRWGADWDWQGVSEALKSISSDELRSLTGFADHELSTLLAADWTKPEQGALPTATDAGHTVHLSPSQYALLTDAKKALDPAGDDLSDANTVEQLCRLLLNPPRSDDL